MNAMDEFLTADELAEMLRVSRRWIQHELKVGGLPHHRLGQQGRLVRFRWVEVCKWVEGKGPRKAASK